VRLPAAVVQVLRLREGDEVEIEVLAARRFVVRRAADAKDVLARLRRFRGKLPADFKFDRLAANERER
jgi:antitoxin MazE